MKRIIINKSLLQFEAKRILGDIKLSPEAENALKEITSIEKVKKHAKILSSGEVCDFIGIVMKGLVQIYHVKDGKKRVSDNFATEGYPFFDIDGYINGKPSSVEIEALEATVFAKIDKKKFESLCEEYEDLDDLYTKILEHEMISSHERLNSVLHHDAEEKYSYLDESRNGLTARISSINVASFIGVTQETLCRIKAKMTDTLY
ncbi:MAG: Crp/Fnr family transcriptional regulator [Paludibacteraceae bacterium]|nr:Crp/Fnr family transcriptional regulator [Bacteroidales bacterium]MBO5132011.1 Crp/Fnr family transcriptional regulator [Paludibacteraceae bacterium]MBR6659910.1 Crp/Fnr family transcriptional regulator [Paludibacteraceae bacterium]